MMLIIGSWTENGKIPYLKCHNAFSKFNGDPARKYAWVVGDEIDVYFQRFRLKTSPLNSPMINHIVPWTVPKLFEVNLVCTVRGFFPFSCYRT